LYFKQPYDKLISITLSCNCCAESIAHFCATITCN